jgi:hypothetical protein
MKEMFWVLSLVVLGGLMALYLDVTACVHPAPRFIFFLFSSLGVVDMILLAWKGEIH